MENQLANLRYIALPSLCPNADYVELHNQAFGFWRESWKALLEELNFDAGNIDAEWGRQNYISCLADGDKPVALHLYSFFHLGALAAQKQNYMKNYPPEFFTRLNELGVKKVVSLEFMTVHPDYRKSQGGIHLGAAMSGLANYVAREKGLDAAIAPARRDLKVNELAYAFGGECIIENVMNHNVACDLVAIRLDRVRPFPDPRVAKLIQALWEKRESGF